MPRKHANSPLGGTWGLSWAFFIQGHSTWWSHFTPQDQVFASRVQSRYWCIPGCCLEKVSRKPS